MERFHYDALAGAGITKVVISYSGSGDEGWINDIVAEPPEKDRQGILTDDLYRKLESAAMDVLEENYGGWEIDSGSSGHITIDVAKRSASIEHGWVVESTQYENTEVT